MMKNESQLRARFKKKKLKKMEKNKKKLHGTILRAEDTKHSHECRHVFKKENHLISSLTKDLLLFIFCI